MKHHHSRENESNQNTHTEQTQQPVESSTCEAQIKEIKEQLLRTSADLQNFKNRVSREKSAWLRDAQASLITKLLPVVDNFERALGTIPTQGLNEQERSWINGIKLTYKEFEKFLQQADVHAIDCTKAFDPHVHEAIAHIDAPEKKSGDIVQVNQKGYVLADKVIRPAQVTVAK